MTMRYDANEILRRVLGPGEDHISDKALARRLNTSERQIRNARLKITTARDPDGTYLIDRLCIKGLKQHPAAVFGFEAWVEPVMSELTADE